MGELDAVKPASFRRGILLPCGMLLIAMVNLTLIVAGLKELILDELGGSTRDASLFFSIEMAAYLLFAPLCGVLSDRLGRRKPLIFLGFLASAVFYAAFTQAESIGLLLGLRFAQGAFSVMAWSTLMALVLDYPDDARRGRNAGIMGAALIFGVSLGAPLGGVLSGRVGVYAPLWAAAALFLLLVVLVPLLHEPSVQRRKESARAILDTLTSRPRLLLPYLFYFVDRYTVGFFVVLFPLYLASLGTDDPAVRGQYLALYLLPFAALQYFTGRLAERVGPYRPLLFGSLLYGLVLMLVGWSDLFALWPVMALLGVLASVMFPPCIFLTAQLSDAGTRGTAMGGFNFAGSLGFTVGPLVGAWAFELYGFGFAFLTAGALEVVAAIVGFVLIRRWGLLESRLSEDKND